MILAALVLLASAMPPQIEAAALSRTIAAHDGDIVRVSGWVDPRCGGLNCQLTSRPVTDDERPSVQDSVRIGHVEEVEPSLVAAAGRQVVLEGRVSATCRREVCTDRAPDLVPIRLVHVYGVADATKEH